MAETTYICSEDASNKFWSYEQNGSEVTFKWGRVGRPPETLTKDFGSPLGAEREIAKKLKEKTRKGYKLVDEKKLQQETETAHDLGTRNKIKDMVWVSRKGNELKKLDKYDPKQYVYVEVLDSYDKAKSITRILLSKTETFILDDGIYEEGRTIMANGLRSVSDSHPFAAAVRKILKRMAEVVQAALKSINKFESLGKRKLFDDEDVSGTPEVATVLDQINSAGFERGVINKFASLGQRVLDL